MSRNGSGGVFKQHTLIRFLDRVAFFAPSIPLFAKACVCLVVFMSFGAMCFGFLARSVGFSTESKTFFIDSFLFTKNFTKGKTLIRSFCDRVWFYSNDFCKLCRLVLFAIYNNKFGISSVQLLLGTTRPFTIFWRVAKIVVYSVKRVALWPFAHVRYKVFKAFAATNRPAITNGYPPASVIGKMFKVWLLASNNHSMPA